MTRMFSASHSRAFEKARHALYDEVLGEQGYSSSLCLTPSEHVTLKGFIYNQYANVMREAVQDYDTLCGDLDIDQYHKISHFIDHKAAWPKRNRCLPQENINLIKEFSIFDILRETFGHFTFSKIIYENNEIGDHEEVYWRLVRPHEESDVGALHTDRWFNDLLHLEGRIWPEGSYTLKLWIAVSCTPGLSGLAIVPGSHQRAWDYSATIVNGNPRPRLLDEIKADCIPTTAGHVLLFPEETLHGGIFNRSDMTRVSAEITLVFPKRPDRPS